MSREAMSKDPPGIERILFTEEQIAQRIQEVAVEISERYRGKTLKLVGVLKGSVFFLTALARHIQIPVKIDFLAISTFSNKSSAPGIVRIAKDLDDGIENEDVLLVERELSAKMSQFWYAAFWSRRRVIRPFQQLQRWRKRHWLRAAPTQALRQTECQPLRDSSSG